MPEPINDDELRLYLTEELPSNRMAQVEKALRESAALRERLEEVRQGRPETMLHSLGAIWRRHRLTCLSREQLGSFLLDVLDPEFASYIRFHLDVVACPFCRANFEDLKQKAQDATQVIEVRRQQIFQTSRHLLSGEE